MMYALPYGRRYRRSSAAVLMVVLLLVPGLSARGVALAGPGDTNCDGVVNYADIDPFVLALAGQAGYETVFPDCPWLNADCNGDDSVDYADIDAFIALLTGPAGACCMGADAEPGYAPYECIGDMAESICEAIGAGTSWHEGESCDDPLFLCPGTLVYCDGSGDCDEYISHVVCGAIDNVTACTHYGDYTDLSAEAVLGASVELSVWNGSLYVGDETLVWVDWNQDGDWADDGEFVGAVVSQEVATIVFDVPPTAFPGETRMRIRIDYSPPTPYEPCGFTSYGEVEDYTLIVAGDMPVGACCDPYTGLCADEVQAIDCQTPLQFHTDALCAGLSPVCGNPGACCDDDSAVCAQALELNCSGRFAGGVTCDPDPFDPACGDWHPSGLLYAPANSDNTAFRTALAALLGAPVDYFDTRVSTPTLDMLQEYGCVLTWVNYAYANKVAMGNVLADYVDAGGRVLLGQWTQPTANNYLAGAIMEVGGAYLPATATARSSGTYTGDGYGCPFAGVEELGAPYRDDCTLTDIGFANGTWTDGYLCTARRADNAVWATPGNTGSAFGSGDWVQLTANLCICPPGEVFGACCDRTTGTCQDNVNALDCIGFPYSWTYETLCDDLIPPCGTPGACCDDNAAVCTEEFQVNCPGRFAPGETCDDVVFVPPCGEWTPVPVLYCPTTPDNATFRVAVSRLLNGSPVDYFDARVGTPTLEMLQDYACVLTWVNYAYADKVAMGDVLAEFVDQGGRVLLGQWTQPTAGNYLAGAIMEIDGPYLPAMATTRGTGMYAGDGYGCTFARVHALVTAYRDNCTVTAIGLPIGTWTDGYLCVAHRGDNRVWANPGNTGTDYSTGDWARLTANLCTCPPGTYYGACCDLTTGQCEDNVNIADCIGWPYQWAFDTLCDDLVPVCGNPGACCDIYAGECTAEYEVNCPPGARFEGGVDCAFLDPPCGTPGACCDDATGDCTETLKTDCVYRFMASVACEPDPFDPACGAWHPTGLLYAPTNADNPEFRAAVSALLDGAPVDYFDARTGTPTLEQLRQYKAVLTWVNYPYADKVAMGDVLAEYVDLGGRVLLGQWTQPTATNFLSGAIMEIDGPYLPATATDRGGGVYSGNGHGCEFVAVDALGTPYRDNCTPTPIGTANGTWNDGWLCVAHRADKHVWVTPGNAGAEYGTGDWAKLTANLCYCPAGDSYGACCNVETGLCIDNVAVGDCYTYPLEWTLDTLCADLEPACGNPGACCDDATSACTDTIVLHCPGRFAAGESCASYEFSPPCGDITLCYYALTMWDDYGDGWNGGHVDVYLDGMLIAGGVTLQSGYGPQTVPLAVYDGGRLETVWTSGGWPYEASYCIYDAEGIEIICEGVGGVVPGGATMIVICEGGPCGDGICQPSSGENCLTCHEDCGECACLQQLPNAHNGHFSDIDCDFCNDGPIQVLAENFRFMAASHVSVLRIWGGYYPNDMPLESDQFTIVFRADEGGLPGAVRSTYGPLAGTRTQTGVIMYSVHEYAYELVVSEDFEVGTYWVEIYNDTSGSTDAWFWETGDTDWQAGITGQAYSVAVPEAWEYDDNTDVALDLVCLDMRSGDRSRPSAPRDEAEARDTKGGKVTGKPSRLSSVTE